MTEEVITEKEIEELEIEENEEIKTMGKGEVEDGEE